MSRVKRRLAAILCADVVNYSGLMERDEQATLLGLRQMREAMSGLVEMHGGRTVNTWGDAVICEFSSVVEAVQCAVEIQDELAGSNPGASRHEEMRFRIGLNLGDIMIEGDDIYGDGVNIAARLQEVAEPGGIVISAAVYDHVHAKLAIGFEPLGAQKVKHLTEPIRSYRIRTGGINEPADAGARGAYASKGSGDNAAAAETMAEDAFVSRNGLERLILRFRQWYSGQPKRVRFAVAMIGMFFTIDVLTGSSVWFYWPSLPFAFVILSSQFSTKERE